MSWAYSTANHIPDTSIVRIELVKHIENYILHSIPRSSTWIPVLQYLYLKGQYSVLLRRLRQIGILKILEVYFPFEESIYG